MLITRTIVNPTFRAPVAEQFSFQLRRQLGATWALTAGWAGTKGTASFMSLDGNPTVAANNANGTVRVAKLEGIAHVDNQIEVLPLSPFDDRLRIAVARAVYGQPALNRYALGANPPIRIVVKNGNVTLEGVVNDSGARNIANIQANGVPGVFSVTNNLRVEK